MLDIWYQGFTWYYRNLYIDWYVGNLYCSGIRIVGMRFLYFIHGIQVMRSEAGVRLTQWYGGDPGENITRLEMDAEAYLLRTGNEMFVDLRSGVGIRFA